MNWSDPSTIISIFAIIIAGISLIWNIVSSIKKNKPSLKVNFSILQQFTSSFRGELSDFTPVFSIIVTNIGFIVRDIENPSFNLIGFDLNGNKMFTVLDTENPINFPIEILPGKQFKHTSSVIKLLTKFSKELPAKSKIKIIINDTYGKKYKSKAIRLSNIMNQIELSKNANS